MLKFSGYWFEDLLIVLSAVVAFFGGIVALKRYLFSFLFEETNKKFEMQAQEINEIKLSISMLVMHDDNVSLAERVKAGQSYVSSGGNGAEALFYDMLKDTYKKEVLRNKKILEESSKK